jgi:hypothetical protein
VGAKMWGMPKLSLAIVMLEGLIWAEALMLITANKKKTFFIPEK